MRLKLILSMLLLALPVAGRCALPAYTDSLPAHTGFRYHWRIRPVGKGENCFGLAWNITGSSYNAAHVVLADERYNDGLGRASAVLTLLDVRDGVATVTSTHQLSLSDAHDGMSIVLERRKYTAKNFLRIGGHKAQFEMEVDVRPFTRLGGYTETKADTLRSTYDCYAIELPPDVSFADATAVRQYLSGSTDIRESEWVYHDRDTDPLRLGLDISMRLATVADGRGGYFVVRLDGDSLSTKATLTPTGFIDEYDMCWYDAVGEPMGSDCSAHIEQASMITFSFPLYKSKVRFRRTRL